MSPYGTPVNPDENVNSKQSAAPRAAVVMDNVLLDPDLAAIIEAWADLPESVKMALMEMVRG